jgi:hypothetical protein
VFGTTGPGWPGVAAGAWPTDGVTLRAPVAGTRGVAGDTGVLDTERVSARGTAWDDETRGAVPKVAGTVGPVGAEPALGVPTPPNSRLWSLREFILDARSCM